jgi:aminopeptidase-like protein
MIKNIYLWCRGFYHAEWSDKNPDQELHTLWVERVIDGNESIIDFLQWRKGYIASKCP